MGCEEVRDVLALVAGGEARDDYRAAVEDHVSHCAPCSKELDAYREARTHLALLREEDAPPGTFRSLWTDVKADLFPAKSPRALAGFDASLRYAAVVMVGVAIGVGAHVATRGPAKAPVSAERTSRSGTVLAPVHTVTTREPAPFRVETPPRPKFYAPRARPEGNSWLPRVELIPAGGERDF